MAEPNRKLPPLTQQDIERFWSKVDRNGPVPEHRPELGPCWVWTAGTFRRRIRPDFSAGGGRELEGSPRRLLPRNRRRSRRPMLPATQVRQQEMLSNPRTSFSERGRQHGTGTSKGRAKGRRNTRPVDRHGPHMPGTHAAGRQPPIQASPGTLVRRGERTRRRYSPKTMLGRSARPRRRDEHVPRSPRIATLAKGASVTSSSGILGNTSPISWHDRTGGKTRHRVRGTAADLVDVGGDPVVGT
jgi:hypothetical protein